MTPYCLSASTSRRAASSPSAVRQTLIHPVGRRRSPAPAASASFRCSSAAPKTSGFIAAAVSPTRDELENWKYCQSAWALAGSAP